MLLQQRLKASQKQSKNRSRRNQLLHSYLKTPRIPRVTRSWTKQQSSLLDRKILLPKLSTSQNRGFDTAFRAYKAHHLDATEKDFIDAVKAKFLREVVVVKYRGDSEEDTKLYETMTQLASSVESLVTNLQFESPQGRDDEGTYRLRAGKLRELLEVLRPYQEIVGLSRPERHLKTEAGGDYRSAEFFVNFNKDDVKTAVEKAEQKIADLDALGEEASETNDEVLQGLKKLVKLLKGMLTKPHEDWECKDSSPTLCGVKELFTAVIGSTSTDSDEARFRVTKKAAESGSHYFVCLGSRLITVVFVPDGYVLMGTDRALGMWPLLIQLEPNISLALRINHQANEPDEETIRILTQSKQIADRVRLETLFEELRQVTDQDQFVKF